jgi:uncharacterized phage protein gp47/JayE
MPWSNPTLEAVRTQSRDAIATALKSGSLIPNSRARVFADNNAGLAHLTLQYIDWLSSQFLPDTAEAEWLHRHALIWLGGWKQADFAIGIISVTGAPGTVVPLGAKLTGGIGYEVTAQTTIGSSATSVPIRATTPGIVGNADAGSNLSFASSLIGVDGSVVVISLTGGIDEENDDDLRLRVLDRIRKPPMGGDADDYVAWTLEVPGVTRAWSSPLEMGMGTVTIRFMMDILRSSFYGFPTELDLAVVKDHLNSKRPVAVKDFFVLAPTPEPINFSIANLSPDDAQTRILISNSVRAMFAEKGAPAFAINGIAVPAQTIYSVWVAEAGMQAAGVEHFDLIMDDHVMPDNGRLAVLGTITYV